MPPSELVAGSALDQALGGGTSFTSNVHTAAASQGPYAWANNGLGRYGSNSETFRATGRDYQGDLSKSMFHAEEAKRLGYINEAEFDWLYTVNKPGERRSTIEKLLGYKAHTGGVLGALDDVFGVLETVSGYRAMLSVSAAVTEGLKQKGSWGFAFSTEEFKRAWSGEVSESGRTSYKDILMQGGNELKGAGGFATTLAFDIMLDPATYLTFGLSAAAKVSIGQGGKLSRAVAEGAEGALKVVKGSKKSGRTAEQILKQATGAKDIPSSLTLTRYGSDMFQVASRELIETQPKAIKKILNHLDDGDADFVQGGLEILSPTDLTRLSAQPLYRRAVTEYAVRNFDRLAMRLSGWEDQAATLAGKGLSELARTNLRRGPGSMFQQFNMSSIGGFMVKGAKTALNPIGAARDIGSRAAGKAAGPGGLFQETAGVLAKERGLRTLGRASVAGQALGGLAMGDPNMLLSAAGTAITTEIPALAVTAVAKALPTSAVRWTQKSFQHGIERMPVEDATELQRIKSGMDLAVEGKKSELVGFFDAKIVHEVNHLGKTTSRKLSKGDREIIARHMDKPALNMIEDGSPLYEPMQWIKQQFVHIAEQERELGILGSSWGDYVTHYYGSKRAGAVAKFMKNRGTETRRLLWELDRSNVANSNSFALHRVVATFDDAEKLLGKGALDTDIGSILARRWSSSIRMQSKMRAQRLMIERHGISALGEGFKNSHAAINQIGGKLGNLARNFVDLGPPQRASKASIAKLADSFTDAATVKGVDWFATSEDAIRRIRKARGAAAARKARAGFKGSKGLPEFSATISRAVKEAASAKVDRATVLKSTRNQNLKALDKIAKSAFNKPASKLSMGELGALDDYLNLTVLKNKAAIKTFETVGKMNNTHRLSLVEIGVTGGAGIRPSSAAHRLAREAPEYSDRQLMAIGRKLANSEGSATRRVLSKQLQGAADPSAITAIKRDLKAEQALIDRKYRELGRKAVARSPKQEPKRIRTVIEQGLERSAAAARKKARSAKAKAARLRKKVPEVKHGTLKAAASVHDRILKAKKALGDHNAALSRERQPLVDTVARLTAQLDSARAKLELVTERIGRGVYRGVDLKSARNAAKTHGHQIEGAARDLRKAKKDLAKIDLKPKKESSRLSSAVGKLQAEQKALRTQLKEDKDLIELWTKASELDDSAAEIVKGAERLGEIADAEKALGSRQDTFLHRVGKDGKGRPGQWYVPEVWLDAIDQSFGHTWNPSSKIDRMLAAWQRFQLLWKIPLTLPFAEHHGRNAITNAFLMSGQLGFRMLNPGNWRDMASVMAVAASRIGKEGDVARAAVRTSTKKVKGLPEPDLRGVFGNHVIKTANGHEYTASEIFRQATFRSITHGFVSAEVDAVAGTFGDLFHGRLVPNLGSMRTAADLLSTRARAKVSDSVATEGVLGGTAVAAAKLGAEGLGSALRGINNSARWVSRKAEHVVDVPFRVAMFTDAVKRGKSFDDAAEVVRQHLNDWSRLSSFEKKYARSIIPFYSWIQFSAERFIKDLTTNPTAITNPIRLTKSIQTAMESEPPTSDYQSDWMAERVGIWEEEGEGLYKRYLLNGINADEAMRQVAGLTELTRSMAHNFAKLTGADALAWTTFAPDGNPKDDLRFLAQMDFMAVSVVEGLRGRDFFSGAPTGTVDEVLQDEGYSRYSAARHLVHPGTRDNFGSRMLRGLLDVEEIEGDPKAARANATRRWLLGRTPPARFISAYERKQKAIVAALDSGDMKSAGRLSFEGALEGLGTRAYIYDEKKQKLYYYRDRVDAAQRLLLNAGYYQKFGRVYRPKTVKARKK